MNPHVIESMNEFVAAHGGKATGPVLRLRGVRQLSSVFATLDEKTCVEITLEKRASIDDERFGSHVISFEISLPFERHCYFFGFTSEKAAMECWDAIVPEDDCEPIRLRMGPRPVPQEDEAALAGVIA